MKLSRHASRQRWSWAIVGSLTSLLALSSLAAIVGPYEPDADTLHLWHMDAATAPIPDEAGDSLPLVVLGNGATLEPNSFPGFGGALSTLDGGQSGTDNAAKDAYLAPLPLVNGAGDNVRWSFADPETGAFTFEAVVWVGFDPTMNLGSVANGGNGRNQALQIITGEQDGPGGGTRSWQFRLLPVGYGPGELSTLRLEFINVNNGTDVQSIVATIPTEGPHAILSNGWYHVAVTYNGAESTMDNLRIYWTTMSEDVTEANEIWAGPMARDLATGAVDFCIGNTGRNPPNGNWLGLIDEVRISKVARSPEGMMFGRPEPAIATPPADQTVSPGQTAVLKVTATGLPPLYYQWSWYGTNLPGATESAYIIPDAQFADAGPYTVTVTNKYGTVTSDPATLVTVRTPRQLVWAGYGSDWNTTDVYWDSDQDGSADTAFIPGDAVRFDSVGSWMPTIMLTQPLNPSSVTMDADTDYTLTTETGGALVNKMTLIKKGTGTLVVDTDNSYIGPTIIENGALQIGNGTSRGTLGQGPVTNNGALVIARTGSLTLDDLLGGSGSLTNDASNTVTLSGTNRLSGPVTLNAGTLRIVNPEAKGASPAYILNSSPNAQGTTTLSVGGGITFGPETTIALLDASSDPDLRSSLRSLDATNTFNGPIVLSGTGNLQFWSDGPADTSLFVVTTPLIDCPDYTGQLILRGNGNGLITSQLRLGRKVSKTDGGTWTITSTGNSWLQTDVAGGRLRMGAPNVFPATARVNVTTADARLDLAGFDQQIGTLTGVGVIASSSTTADCTLTVHPDEPSLFNGTIRDATGGGTRKVGLTLAGGTLTLGGDNIYTGDTLIQAGTLELLINGAIGNSATIRLAAGATINVTLRTDTTLTVNPGQTLTGDGTFNITGNFANNGTVALKLNKAGNTLTSDRVNVSGALAYGGTLQLNVTASPALAVGDAFQLFNAGDGYSGQFAAIVPDPGPGLSWDTSTLATDGVLRVAGGTEPPTSTNITVGMVDGNTLELTWPESHLGWLLLVQTNSVEVGLSSNWVPVPDSGATNRHFIPIDPANGSVFYRLVSP